MIKAVSALFILALFIVSAHAQTDKPRVVIIPMAGDEANCTWRETNHEPLDSNYTHISSYCESDERIITGGFRYHGNNVGKDCRVIQNYPLLKPANPIEGWKVTWGMPSHTECSIVNVITLSFCCKE